jgi:hypothetical protein
MTFAVCRESLSNVCVRSDWLFGRATERSRYCYALVQVLERGHHRAIRYFVNLAFVFRTCAMNLARLAMVLLVIACLGADFYVFRSKRGLSRSSNPFLSAPAQSRSNPSRDGVETAYKALDQSVRTGNGPLYLSLLSKASLAITSEAQRVEFQKNVCPRPSVYYQASAIRVEGNRAALIGSMIGSKSNSYHHFDYVFEDGAWKLDHEVWSDQPFKPAALYAFLPPSRGSFTRAGLPWERIPYSRPDTKYSPGKPHWKLQATQDDSFLYIRFDMGKAFPAPGAEIISKPGKTFGSGLPPSPPVMTIDIRASVATDSLSISPLRMQSGPVSQSQATFGPDGHATSNRYFLQYSLCLSSADLKILFTNSTNDSFPKLISAQGQFLDISLPLGSLDVPANTTPNISIRESSFPSGILPYNVAPFSE